MTHLGIDIGGTKTRAVVVDASTRVLSDTLVATGRGPSAVLRSAEGAARTAVAGAGCTLADIASIGVGIPGSVDHTTGRVSHAVNLDLEELALGELLGARLGRPVAVENDVKAAALGAFHLQGATGSMAYLNLGTGLAAGLVVDGLLWRGHQGVAGEIGHIPVRPDGEECRCGQRGCLETVASGSGLARRWPTARDQGIASLFDAADAGQAEAVAVRDDLVDGVAAAVRLLVLTTGVERVVIGGGLSVLGDRLLAAVTEVLASWATGSPFLASVDLAHRVRIMPAHSPVGAVGAALVGRY